MNRPDCKGVGKVYGFGRPGFRPMELPCPTQTAPGRWMPPMRYGRSKESGTDRRIERRETVRQCAVRLGVDPLQLSHFEHGRTVSEETLSKVREETVNQ